jgi:transposase
MSRTSRAEWAKRVERWRESGLSAKEYAAETGVKASTLSYWSWRLKASDEPEGGRSKAPEPVAARRKESRAADGATARFVELSATASAPTPALELVLSSGIRVRVTSGFDEATLTRMVRALEASR